MFIIAVLTTVKTWKQPKCPLMHKCKKKIIHIYISQMSYILYYSVLKKRPYHTQYKDEAVAYMLNKINQIEKEKNQHDLTYM